MSDRPGLTAKTLAEILLSGTDSQLASAVSIPLFAPGHAGPVKTLSVTEAKYGFDWGTGLCLIVPTQQLTTLAPEDVAAIRTSVAKGQSWHSYQAREKDRARVALLEAEIKVLKGKLGVA